MVIIGLGSNIGDRLENLRQALRYLKKMSDLIVIEVSPVYVSDALLPENAPDSWNQPYLNACVKCLTTLEPQALLKQTKTIEKNIGKIKQAHWGPRLIDIDLLAWDDRVIYGENLHIPHEHLHERPFMLLPLADVAPFWINPLPNTFKDQTAIEMAQQWKTSIPLNTKPIPQRIDTPKLMGIINVTPDSFSEDQAIQTISAEDLINAGAELIDLGAEATGPKAAPLTWEVEWSRLKETLSHLAFEKHRYLITPKIGIDTYHPETASQALNYDIDYINDVTGLDNPEMRALLSQAECDVIFMHHLGVPVSRSAWLPLNEDPVTHVYQWAEKRRDTLVAAGIAASRLIFDPGIGYGKTSLQSLQIIKNIEVFKQLNIRILVGHSRKSFLRQFTHHAPQDRDIETVTISQFLANKEVDYLRIHNVDFHARAFRCMKALQ